MKNKILNIGKFKVIDKTEQKGISGGLIGPTGCNQFCRNDSDCRSCSSFLNFRCHPIGICAFF